ncbi:UNVERIFIED_CONTAM: hypothetical protein Sradi_5874200 [Sesamum radiatum]|uniref:Uncharacterized protein n=1 Tax=Sesamum radiatum TaxID=300843 RepID=A0AAW2KRI9_SESRA
MPPNLPPLPQSRNRHPLPLFPSRAIAGHPLPPPSPTRSIDAHHLQPAPSPPTLLPLPFFPRPSPLSPTSVFLLRSVSIAGHSPPPPPHQYIIHIV